MFIHCKTRNAAVLHPSKTSVQCSFRWFDSSADCELLLRQWFGSYEMFQTKMKMKLTHSVACRLQLIKKMSKQQLYFEGEHNRSLSEYIPETRFRNSISMNRFISVSIFPCNQSSCKRCKLKIICKLKTNAVPSLANSPIFARTERSIWKYLESSIRATSMCAFE